MAIFHLRITPLSRASGGNALQTAARYAATVLVDHRTGAIFDFSKEPGVVHQEIMGPGNDGCRWQDQQSLWKEAEMAEERKDARVAREYEIALPHELNAARRIELARRWAKFIAERYGNVVDLTVRAPSQGGDPRNHYAKLLATTRVVSSGGLVVKLPSSVRVASRADRKNYGFCISSGNNLSTKRCTPQIEIPIYDPNWGCFERGLSGNVIV